MGEFRAAFPGECAALCSEGIRPGDRVRRAEDGGVEHVVCPEPPPVLGARCERCMLIHPGEC